MLSSTLTTALMDELRCARQIETETGGTKLKSFTSGNFGESDGWYQCKRTAGVDYTGGVFDVTLKIQNGDTGTHFVNFKE